MSSSAPQPLNNKYPKLFAAGGICASLSHAVTVPIDVVKTRMQVTPGVYKGLGHGIKLIYAESGFMGLMRGFMPTMYGFAAQGALKYGLYEYFKDQMAARNPNYVPGTKPPVLDMILAASAAETFGTTALVPFEAARIRMVSNPALQGGTVGVLRSMLKEQGLGGIYIGLPPILAKQVPYTVTQFLVYETVSAGVYKELRRQGVTDIGAVAGTGITLGCSIVSGVTASVVSQPGDTVLTYVNKSSGKTIPQAIQELGLFGLFTGGKTRCVHVTSYVVMQFLIYDSIKRMCGIPVAGAQAK